MENETMNNVPTVEPVVEPVVEEPVVDPVVEPVTEEPTVEPEVIQDPIERSILDAVVSGAKKLNVRREPSKDADVVCVLAEGTTLTVCPEESTEEFYKVFAVCKEVLVEGYCVKTFIKIV